MKAFWKSKTFWYNVGMIAGMAGGGALGVPIPPAVAAYLLAGGNLILRVVTNQPIGVTDQPAPPAGSQAIGAK